VLRKDPQKVTFGRPKEDRDRGYSNAPRMPNLPESVRYSVGPPSRAAFCERYKIAVAQFLYEPINGLLRSKLTRQFIGIDSFEAGPAIGNGKKGLCVALFFSFPNSPRR
jgi:hypothetical protein